MPQSSPSTNDPHAIRMFARILWGAMLLGCIFIAVSLLAVSQSRRPAEPSPSASTFLFVGAILTLVSIPASFITRGQILKRGWVENIVTPRYYLLGVIISCSICEAIYITTIVFAFIHQFPPPMCIAPAVCFIALLLLFPNGKAMFPLQISDTSNPYRFPR